MKKTIFKEKDRVFHIEYGWGEVKNINKTGAYPVVVCFDGGAEATFTTNGVEVPDVLQSLLSFTEYTLQGFSQDRPRENPDIYEYVMVSHNEETWHYFKYYGYSDVNEGYVVLDDYNQLLTFKYLKRLK